MNRLRVYAQLVRLPNVFTAFADIGLGILATWQLTPEALPGIWSALFLLAASGCLYSGGIVFNDVFDVQQDKRERPSRPIPSGRLSRSGAALFGIMLLIVGIGFAFLAGGYGGDIIVGRQTRLSGAPTGGYLPFTHSPLYIACLLAVLILLYDGWLKRFWAGPLGMGACRFLNVLLGLSLAPNLGWPWGIHLALVVGIYVVGVTWFARTEAQMSSRSALAGAAGVMAVGLLLALPAPAMVTEFHLAPHPFVLFPYVLVALGFLIGFPISRAISRPTAAHVQKAVKQAIMGLVILDATLASAIAGIGGLVILILLLPALYLGRWIYST
jgi:4-hydroxybenzoate polyprenyltransferase